MTLIEIMIVLVIMAAMAVLVVPRINNRNNQFKQLTRRLVVMGKQLNSYSRIQQKTYRVVINMPIDEDKVHSISIESASGNVPIDYEQIKETFENNEKEREEGDPPPTFQEDRTVLKSPIELPPPLRFKDVEIGALDEKFEEGKAYIHFFPQGMVEEVAVHLTDGNKREWTITYHPLTGKGYIISSYVPLKDLRGK